MIFVFEVRTRPGYTAEQYAEAWVRASKLIQRAPGARGTRLHRKIGEPSKLLAVAHWDSKADRDAMQASADETIRKIIESQAAYVDITVIGEYEAPDWVVVPPGPASSDTA